VGGPLFAGLAGALGWFGGEGIVRGRPGIVGLADLGLFRNEPNFGSGRRRLGGGRGGGVRGALRLSLGGGARGLKLAQILQGAAVGALDGIAAALEAGEGLLAAFEGVAVGLLFRNGAALEVGEFGFPELGLGFAEAAEEPLGIDEDIEQGALGGGLGLEFGEVVAGEGGQGGGVLAADDLGLGVDARFQGVLGSGGLALGKAWCRCGISKLQIIKESIASRAANSSSLCYLNVTHARYLNPHVDGTRACRLARFRDGNRQYVPIFPTDKRSGPTLICPVLRVPQCGHPDQSTS